MTSSATQLNLYSNSQITSTQGLKISTTTATANKAGDVNGDGIDDLIIGGSPTYVLYGGKDLTSSIVLSTITKEQGFSITGINGPTSVSGAGDMNKDGFADLVLGFPYASSNKGMVYVIYGGNNITSINLNTLTSKQGFYITGTSSSDTGACVNSAGDVNNDGYGDIIFGATTQVISSSIPIAGVTYIVFGGNSLTNINLLYGLTAAQGVEILGSLSYGYSGFSVAGAGDVNNDGYSDVVIGAYGAYNNLGIAYVVYGGSYIGGYEGYQGYLNLGTMNLTQGFNITGSVSGAKFAYSVSGAGDINNDGNSDIIIGSYTGDAYIIYGKKDASSFKIQGASSKELTTVTGCDLFSVSGAGDVNNDGFADIVVASSCLVSRSYYYNYIIYGNSQLPSNFVLSSLNQTQGFIVIVYAQSVKGAGDINGDGYDDTIYASTTTTYTIYGADSGFVTFSPISYPTFAPSGINASPTFSPSFHPSYIPTTSPSLVTTLNPSHKPTTAPSVLSTAEPSAFPNVVSNNPSFKPTNVPTSLSYEPTFNPSLSTSFNPTYIPTSVPTLDPISEPTFEPTFSPTQSSNNISSNNLADTSSLSTADMAGIIVGGVVGTGLVAFGCFMAYSYFFAKTVFVGESSAGVTMNPMGDV